MSLFLSLTLLLVKAQASASPLTFFNTGVSASGSLLAAGSTDSRYSLIYNPDGAAEVATATAANANWTPNTSSAGWISPGASGNTNWSAGTYVFEATLDLTGFDPATAILSGAVAADDSVSIYLNRTGSALFSSTGFSNLSSFTIHGGFVGGVNLVDFVVTNTGGPTGLMVSNSQATASALTPEPAALLLVATGIVVAGALLRFKSLQTHHPIESNLPPTM